MNFQFEMTKDIPLGTTTAVAAEKFVQLGYGAEDFYNQFPCFIDAKTLARFLSFYYCQTTLGIAGHIAEVGVFRGAVSLFFAKLSLLFESHTTTQIHTFDWFRESDEADLASIGNSPTYYEPYE